MESKTTLPRARWGKRGTDRREVIDARGRHVGVVVRRGPEWTAHGVGTRRSYRLVTTPYAAAAQFLNVRPGGRMIGLEVELALASPDDVHQAIVSVPGQAVWSDELQRYRHNGPRSSWVMQRDSSLPDDGCEVISPAMTLSRAERDVPRVMAAIRELADPVIDCSCGMHVHYDIRWTRNPAQRMLRWLTAQEAMLALVPSSRVGNSYCAPWSHKEIERLRANPDSIPGDSPRGAIAWGAGGDTIEVRLAPSTLDVDWTIAWIRLNHRVMSLRPPRDVRTDATALLDWAVATHGITEHDRTALAYGGIR
jgi:hypothetical protein